MDEFSKKRFNLSEVWQPIELVPGLKGNYDIIGVYDEISGFRVLLIHDTTEKQVELFFSESVWAYRSTDSSFRYNILHDLESQHGSDFYQQHAFFKVDQSAYKQWLVDESDVLDSVEELSDLKHIVIKGINSILDLIVGDDEAPKVRFLD